MLNFKFFFRSKWWWEKTLVLNIFGIDSHEIVNLKVLWDVLIGCNGFIDCFGTPLINISTINVKSCLIQTCAYIKLPIANA